jgi:flavin-dependent dehydrogenase
MRIAVVGAGPAGSAAAFHLATAGRDITLVDRAAFPRDKVCGDWLTPMAVEALAAMGLDDDALAHVAPARAVIRHGALGAPGGALSVAELGRPGMCVPRRLLDAAIRERALCAGCAAVQHDVRDPVSDPALAMFDVVVDARGANVGTPNAVGLRAYWTVPAAALDNDARSTVTLQTDAAYPRGYGWWFPVAVDATQVRMNVGVGLLAVDGRPGRHVTDFFAALETRHPALQRLAARAIERTRPVGYHVGLATWRNRVAHERVLRIGDAANLADPLTGDGIGNALRSGALAAAAILASNNATQAAQRWQALYERDIAPDLRIALALRRALSGTRAKDRAAWLLARSSSLRHRLHGALFGALPYRALLRRRAPPS